MNKMNIAGELAFVASQYGKVRSYWLKKLEGELSKSLFPYDYEFPLYLYKDGKSVEDKPTVESVTFKFHEELNSKLILAMNKSDSRLHMLLTAALILLINKYTGDKDIIIGMPIDKQEVEADFINTLLALRNQIDNNMTFRELLGLVRKTISEARENQNYPIETLPYELNQSFSVDKDFPLFDIVIAVENIQDKKYVRTQNIRPNIIFSFLRTGDDIDGVVEYNPGLYAKATVQRIVDYYIRLTWNALTNADAKLMDISILSDEEKARLVSDYNDTETEYPADKTIHQLFEEQVARTPDNIAVEIAAAEGGPGVKESEKSLTYAQLNHRANHLARLLQKRGLQIGSIVGLMFKPSIEAVIAILAVLKAGAAYMPIDSENPEARIRFFLEDSDAPLLLTSKYLLDEKKDILKIYSQENIICPGELFTEENTEPLTQQGEPLTSVAPSDTVYVIYTSGTTGRPKGVAVEHRGLVNYICWAAANYVKEAPLNFPLYTSLAFDLTVTSIFTPLITGCTVMVYEGEDKVGLIEKIIDDKKVGVIKITPSHLKLILNKKTEDSALERFVLGGEPLEPMLVGDILDNFGGNVDIINEYGPTEAVVGCMKHRFNPAEDTGKSVPLGTPAANAEVYILDENLKPVPIGVSGEMYVAGDGVARGYLNRVELTNERFVPNPFIEGQKMYKTGDMAKWISYNNMEHLGRSDQQLKIRGYRVEIGEVENQIASFPPIKQAVVVARDDDEGEMQLLAYAVPDPDSAYTVRQILNYEKRGLWAGHLVYETPDGMPLVCLNQSETDYMYEEIFNGKSYFKNGIRLDDGACVFDIGANIGMFSLFVNQISANAEIYAFETKQSSRDVLAVNVELYGINAKIFSCGISPEEPKTAPARYADTDEDMRGADEQGEGKYKTLSQVVNEHKVETVDLLKIVVENGDFGVLQGIADDDWKKFRQIVLEAHHVDEVPRKIVDMLENHGYRVTVEQKKRAGESDRFHVFALLPRQEKKSERKEKESIGEKNVTNWYSSERLEAALRHYLAENLAYYMMPAYITFIEQIPLTSNGKVDRNALPEPRATVKEKFAPPQGPIEKKLAAMWSRILGIEEGEIGREVSFFEMGGHSLNATALIAEIHKELNLKLYLTVVFANPTIREQAEYLKIAVEEAHVSITVTEKKEYYPMSPAQERLFVLQRIDKESVGYNVPMTVMLEGAWDREHLESALRGMIKRHDSLRTSFFLLKDEPVQQIHDYGDIHFAVEYHDLSADVETDADEVNRLIASFVKPFDLSRPPLIRAMLIKKEKETYIMSVDMHHIVTDGVSMDLFVKEFCALYGGEELTPLSFQYKDYSEWLNNPKQREALKEQEAYWLEQFQGDIPVLALPLDYERPAVQSFEGDKLSFILPPDESKALLELGTEHGATLYMVLLAVYNVFLSKLSGQEDIVVGTPIASRRHVDLERIVGMFVNTLAFRNFPRGSQSFEDFLKAVKRTALAGFENQDYQFENLVNSIALARDMSRNPLFDTMLALQNVPETTSIPQVDMSALKVRTYESEINAAKFDMDFTTMETAEGIEFSVQYCTKLFKKETVERFIRYFKNILSEVIGEPGIQLGQIEFIPEEEKRRILLDFNDTAKEYPEKQSIHGWFQDQVEKTPDYNAVVYENRSLTYRELNRWANRLANRLRARGLKSGRFTGILMDRALEMITGLLAILKSGGAYLPLDPQTPKDRLEYMLKDTGADLLLTHSHLEDFVDFDGETLLLDREKSEIDDLEAKDSENPGWGEQNELAYAIYTSGSTGRPKGVLIKHSAVLNLALAQAARFNLDASDRIMQFSSISFDASVEQIFMALFSGATLVLVGKETMLDGDKFTAYVNKQAITHLHAVPSFLATLEPDKIRGLRRMISGGEVCPPELAARWISQCDFYNEYGPTETTVTSIELLVKETHLTGASLTIGKPIDNTRVFILDKNRKLVPPGVTGELYIGGSGLASGYLNNPEFTAEQFINDSWPFAVEGEYPIADARLYRTGDLACWRKDGNIDFLGRKDKQVKIRGYRIELGEIENRLMSHHNIKKAVVIDVDGDTGEQGDKYLCAYLVPHETYEEPAGDNDGEVEPEKPDTGVGDVSSYRKYLSQTLPDYMIPTYFAFLEEIPLNTNGKLDRKALPAPVIKSTKEYIAPRTSVEEKLVEIWADILKVEPRHISVDDNFFQLGGHSLKGTVLLTRISQELNVDIPLAELFKTPTIEALANIVVAMDWVNADDGMPEGEDESEEILL